MFVKMLTHMHMVVYTGFGAFEKNKCIFSIAPVGSLEKSRECFSVGNTHRTLCAEAPDAGL